MSWEFLFARLVWQWKSLGRRSVSVFDILWCIYDWELGWVELVLETASQNECRSWVIGKCVIVLCSVVVELFLVIFLLSRRGVGTWRRELFVGLDRKHLQRFWFQFERSSWMLHVKPLPPLEVDWFAVHSTKSSRIVIYVQWAASLLFMLYLRAVHWIKAVALSHPHVKLTAYSIGARK